MEKYIKRRKALANNAYASVKNVYSNREISLETKLRIHNALIESIFLYNCEVWTLTKKHEREIDIFQRILLRRTLGIRWSDKVTNEELYEKTKAKKWSEKVIKRRISWFGHLARLPESCPAKQALYEALKPVKRPRGRPQITWIEIIRKQLKNIGFDTIYDAIESARDRYNWNKIVNKL